MADFVSFEEQLRELEVFVHWLLPRYPEYSVGRTEARSRSDGAEEVTVELRRRQACVGIFRSPGDALAGIGRPEVAHAFRIHLAAQQR
jgi:hypothetical protein